MNALRKIDQPRTTTSRLLFFTRTPRQIIPKPRQVRDRCVDVLDAQRATQTPYSPDLDPGDFTHSPQLNREKTESLNNARKDNLEI
jgi:hypothetical protein